MLTLHRIKQNVILGTYPRAPRFTGTIQIDASNTEWMQFSPIALMQIKSSTPAPFSPDVSHQMDKTMMWETGNC